VETKIPSLENLLKKIETTREEAKIANGKNEKNNEKAI